MGRVGEALAHLGVRAIPLSVRFQESRIFQLSLRGLQGLHYVSRHESAQRYFLVVDPPLLMEELMLTEIGALVSIVKGLVDIAKGGSGMFGGGKKIPQAAVDQLQQRVAALAEQLHQSVALSKMLPVWLKEHSQFNLYADHLSDDEVKVLDSGLKSLVSNSIRDHFSGVFFKTSFACLPGIDAAIKAFQGRLHDLEQQLNGIPPGDAQAWRHAWPVLKVRLNDMRVEALRIENMADDVHSKLVQELRLAGQR